MNLKFEEEPMCVVPAAPAVPAAHAVLRRACPSAALYMPPPCACCPVPRVVEVARCCSASLADNSHLPACRPPTHLPTHPQVCRLHRAV